MSASRKTATQHHADEEHHAAAYLCDRGYGECDAPSCQSMVAPPVDAVVSAAFLEAASPLDLAVALQVLERIEQDLAAQRQRQATSAEALALIAELVPRNTYAEIATHVTAAGLRTAFGR